MALIQCRECGHTVSDKAKACPYCGAPIGIINKIPEAVYQDRNDEEKKTKKKRLWIYGAIAAAVVVVGALCWWLLTPDDNKEVLDVVGQFSHAVENGDSTAIVALYPDAELADSLFVPQSAPKVLTSRDGTHYKVKWDDNTWIELTKNNGKWLITKSQGIFAWPDDALSIAKQTGQWKEGLTDAELSERINDQEFINYLTTDFCNAFKNKVIQKGSIDVISPAEYMMDNWTAGITFANTNDVNISGKDYQVEMRIYDPWLNDGYGGSMATTISGKDIEANSETVFQKILEGHQYIHDNSVKIKWLISDHQLFNKYFTGHGDEYDNYRKANGGQESTSTSS